MSHISKVEVEIQSLDELNEACEQLGIRFVRGQKTYKWYGRYMNDYPLPEGVKPQDLGKCDHAIQVPGCAYEIGLIENAGKKFTLIWDFWNSGGLEQKLGKGIGKLKQAYATVRIKNEAEIRGHQVTQIQRKKGIRLVLSVA